MAEVPQTNHPNLDSMSTVITSIWGSMNFRRFTHACAGVRAASLWLCVAMCSICCATSVVAHDEKSDGPPTGIPNPSIATSLPKQGDPFGSRAALAGIGITFAINYGGEVFGVTSGGIKRGSRYTGQLETAVDIDFDRIAGWKGLTFHTNAFQLHGRGVSNSHLGIFDPVTNYEATPSTRLFEVWFEQAILDKELSVRFGQMRVDYDGEFVNSTTAGLFISASFGWPSFLGSNLPSGGVTYPIIAPGIRLKVQTGKLTVLLAVYNDDPAGPCDGDPQFCNNDGLKFRLRDNPFVIGEVQYKYGDSKIAGELNGQIKIGGFIDFGKFEDKRFGTDGLSLADPLSNGIARRYHQNQGVYAVIDQQIYRPAGSKGDDGIFAFGRVAGLPGDRNTIEFAFDAGLRFSGFIPRRSNDEFGVAFGFNKVASSLSGLDRDTSRFTGASGPVRDSEAVAELTYKAQIMPGLIIQPDIQYIWHPGGKAADPNNPSKPVSDAIVLGVRSVVNY